MLNFCSNAAILDIIKLLVIHYAEKFTVRLDYLVTEVQSTAMIDTVIVSTN